jgi:hypothetical protein
MWTKNISREKVVGRERPQGGIPAPVNLVAGTEVFDAAPCTLFGCAPLVISAGVAAYHFASIGCLETGAGA